MNRFLRLAITAFSLTLLVACTDGGTSASSEESLPQQNGTGTPTPTSSAGGPTLSIMAYIDQIAAGCFSGSQGVWWTPEYCYASADDIPWETFTHLIYNNASIGSDYLVSTSDMFTKTDHISAAELAAAGHRHGKPVLLSILANGRTDGIMAARNDPDKLVNDVVSVLLANELDGVDVDIENGSDGSWSLSRAPGDKEAMINFLGKLRTALDAHHAFYDPSKPMILVAAGASWDAKLWADPAANQYVDQVNLMTYGFASADLGVSWHHNAVRSRRADGSIFAKRPSGSELPSIQSHWERFKSGAGSSGFGSFDRSKLGVGLGLWGTGTSGGILASDPTKGITAPYQVWSTAPTFPSPWWWYGYFHKWSTSQITSRILDFLDPSAILWDDDAKGAYLSIGSTPSDAQFVSLLDERTAAVFVQFLKDEEMGGGFVFQIGYAHLTATNKATNQPRPDRDPFMRALGAAAEIR